LIFQHARYIIHYVVIATIERRTKLISRSQIPAVELINEATRIFSSGVSTVCFDNQQGIGARWRIQPRGLTEKRSRSLIYPNVAGAIAHTQSPLNTEKRSLYE
jgi:hypothetical protein